MHGLSMQEQTLSCMSRYLHHVMCGRVPENVWSVRAVCGEGICNICRHHSQVRWAREASNPVPWPLANRATHSRIAPPLLPPPEAQMWAQPPLWPAVATEAAPHLQPFQLNPDPSLQILSLRRYLPRCCPTHFQLSAGDGIQTCLTGTSCNPSR